MAAKTNTFCASCWQKFKCFRCSHLYLFISLIDAGQERSIIIATVVPDNSKLVVMSAVGMKATCLS